MEKKKQNEELQSRREFFKKAVKGALPILGVIALGPSVLSSCEKDDPDEWASSNSSGGCSSCSGSCKGKCDATCRHKCSGGCKTGCLGVRSSTSGRL